MITYKDIFDANHDVKMVRVFCEGIFFGTIERVTSSPSNEKQWKYFPDGQRKLSGPSLPTIAEVKKTLEAE